MRVSSSYEEWKDFGGRPVWSDNRILVSKRKLDYQDIVNDESINLDENNWFHDEAVLPEDIEAENILGEISNFEDKSLNYYVDLVNNFNDLKIKNNEVANCHKSECSGCLSSDCW